MLRWFERQSYAIGWLTVILLTHIVLYVAVRPCMVGRLGGDWPPLREYLCIRTLLVNVRVPSLRGLRRASPLCVSSTLCYVLGHAPAVC